MYRTGLGHVHRTTYAILCLVMWVLDLGVAIEQVNYLAVYL